MISNMPVSSSLSAGTSLIFYIQSQVSFNDKTTYRNVSVSGDIFIWNQLKVLIKIGSVDFLQVGSQGNPALAYLQFHRTPQDLTTPLANGYSLNTPDINATPCCPLSCLGSHFIPSYRAYPASSILGHLSCR